MVRALLVAGVLLVGLGALFLVLRPDGGSGEPRDRVLEAEIAEGKMEPAEFSVAQDDLVTLRLTSDEPVEVHMHAYDIERSVSPDEPAEVRFDADITGRFEIEDHETEEVLGVLVVRPR